MEFLSQLTLGELAGWILGATAIVCTVLERMPQAISPWTKLFKFIGRAMNGEVLQRLEAIEKQVKQIDEQSKATEAKREEDRVIEARIRIIRLSDELVHEPEHLHSKDYFDQILSDITLYENYCRDHKDFKNDITTMSIKHIKEVYLTCMKDHSFL